MPIYNLFLKMFAKTLYKTTDSCIMRLKNQEPHTRCGLPYYKKEISDVCRALERGPQGQTVQPGRGFQIAGCDAAGCRQVGDRAFHPPDPQTVARLAEILDTPPMCCWACVRSRAFPPPWAATPSAAIPNPRSRWWAPSAPGMGALAFEEDYGKSTPASRIRRTTSSSWSRATAWSRAFPTATLALVHRQNTLDNGDLGVLVYGADGEGTLKSISSAATRSCCSLSTRPMTKWSSKGEELDHLYIAKRVLETKAKW